MFHDHVTHNRFDLFEMSLSAYLELRLSGRAPTQLRWVALPVFLSKAMLVFELCTRRDSDIHDWNDLRGRVIGVPDVHMTAAVWLRILLRELTGVAMHELSWVNGRPPQARHSTALGAAPLPGVAVHELPPGTTLQEALESGQIDAAFGDHAAAAVAENERVRRVFDTHSVQATMEACLRRCGCTPVNHVMVLQAALMERDAQLPATLMALLEASKQRAYTGARVDAPAGLRFDDDDIVWAADVFGEDPYPSGVATNRAMLTLLLRQLAAEGQLTAPGDLDELFAHI